MQLEKQTCSLQLSKTLKELGIIQDSYFYHFPNPNIERIKKKFKLRDYIIVMGDKLLPNNYLTIKELTLIGSFLSTYSAFTVSELYLMLGNSYPSWSFKKSGKEYWIATAINKNAHNDGKNITTAPEFDRFADTQADALAKLLIDVLKTKHLKMKEANKRLNKK